MPEVALAETELLTASRHSVFSDRYHRQHAQTLAWLKQALSNLAHRRDVERTNDPVCQEELRSRLAELSGYSKLAEAMEASIVRHVQGEATLCYKLATPAGIGFSGVVLDPPHTHARGVVIGARGDEVFPRSLVQSYLEQGYRVVLPSLARGKRSYIRHAQRQWYSFGDAELLHLFAFVVGGSLPGLEAVEIQCVATYFGRQQQESLPVVLDMTRRHTLTATLAAALLPYMPETLRPDFRLLVLDDSASLLNHQEADVRANTIWGFHQHFDALTILSLVQPTQLLFLEATPTPSDVYLHAKNWLTDLGATVARIVSPDLPTVASTVADILGTKPDQADATPLPVQPALPATETCEQDYLDALDSKLAFLNTLHEAAALRRKARYALDKLTPEVYRARVADSLRKVTGPPLPRAFAPCPRTHLAASQATYDIFEIVLTSVPGVDTAGYLLLPKTQEPRAAVICQHGLGGRPEILAGLNNDLEGGWVYDRFAQRLAEKGYVAFVPFMNWGWAPTEARDTLAKYAFALGCTPNRFEVAQLHAIVDFLQARPEVIAEQIAFYGLSYGGHASLWLCAEEPRLCAVITAGHFNDWQRKLTSLELSPPLVRPTSYITVDEGIDMFNYNILEELGHAELATRYAPRPYMVENGLQDSVAPTAWVNEEFGRVKAVFDWLGAGDAVELEHFDGPHRVWAENSFRFLHRHLHQNY